MPSTTVTSDQLQQALSDAIDLFARNRFAILQDAVKQGGEAEVNQVLTEYDALRDAYYQLLRTQLDQNNAQYDTLTKQAKAETTSLKSTIKDLGEITAIIGALTTVVNTVGRVLMVLGVA